MRKLWATLPSRTFSAALLGGACTAALADIRLDLLSRCDDMQEITQFMQAGRASDTANCRDPRTTAERAILGRIGGSEVGLCFLAKAPAPMLEGFSCLSGSPGGAEQLICYREADPSDVAAYKRRAKVGSATSQAANDYKVNASKCAVTNGSSLSAIRTTMPFPLVLVSRFDFGFSSKIGKGRRTNATIDHSFASTDPSLQGAPPAIEYVSALFTDGKLPEKQPVAAIGGWELRVDPLQNFDKAINQALKQAREAKGGPRLSMSSQSFDIARNEEAAAVGVSKTALSGKLQAAAMLVLAKEGFVEMADDEVRAQTGRTKQQITEDAFRNTPYGYRSGDSPKASRALRIAHRTAGPACTNAGEGAFAAYAMVMPGTPDDGLDFGSLLVQILSMGACASQTRSSNQTYLLGLRDGIHRGVRAELGQN